MDDLSSKSVLIYDHGQFCDLATRLARDFGEVLYYKPWKKSAPQSMGVLVGHGMEGVTRIRDFFDYVDRADLIVFPDCYDGDLQVYLESKGRRVWGSRKAEGFEFMRQKFKETLPKVGLPVNDYVSITGISKLRDYLKSNDDQIVKVTVFRGDTETFDCPKYEWRKSKIDCLEAKYGPFAEDMQFVVEAVIDSDIEAGYDGICIDGEFTDGFVDYEIKNRCCLTAFQPYSQMSDEVKEVNEAFSPLLKQDRYRSTFGTEIRPPYFIDATCRTPSPPGELIWEMMSNLPQVMWEGADGTFVQAEQESPYGCELMLRIEWEDQPWKEVYIPKENRRWVKICTYAEKNGICYPIANEGYEPLPWGTEIMGAALGIGNTIEEAIEMAKNNAESVEGLKVTYDTASLYEALQEVKKAESFGIHFSDEPLPEPQSALD